MQPVFVIHTYRDGEYAVRLCAQVRSFYPDAPILLIADGEDQPGVKAAIAHLTVTYIVGDRLKVWRKRGEWTLRWMRLALAQGGNPVVKLDADASLERPFLGYPTGDIGGRLVSDVAKGITFVRGGCVAYQQSAIAKIVGSRLLASDLFDVERHTYRRYGNTHRLPGDPPKSNEAIWLEDIAIADIANRLGLTLASWDDVFVAYREPVPPNPTLEWAVRHPVRRNYGD